VVAQGYDRIAREYQRWASGIVGDPRLQWTEALLDGLPETPYILELGSGAGVEPTPLLARRGHLVGVDISAEQIHLASRRVPGAQFIHGDLTEIDFRNGSFDAVVALYVLTHIPSQYLPTLFLRIGRWLRPHGRFLGTFSTHGGKGKIVPDWLGAPMFFDNFHPDQTRRALGSAGLVIVRDEVITIEEPGHGDTSFLWFLASKVEHNEGCSRQ
jgi:SAM-dependent methyltransferase